MPSRRRPICGIHRLASVIGTFDGKPYKDLQPTGEAFSMRVIDWWLIEGDRLTEKLVFLDLIAFYLEAGVDLFDRMRTMKRVEQ